MNDGRRRGDVTLNGADRRAPRARHGADGGRRHGRGKRRGEGRLLILTSAEETPLHRRGAAEGMKSVHKGVIGRGAAVVVAGAIVWEVDEEGGEWVKNGKLIEIAPLSGKWMRRKGWGIGDGEFI